jgi:hypothetical protein
MQMNSKSLRITSMRFLTLAFSMAAGASFAVGQSSHTVTIDVTTSLMSYSESINGVGQPGSAYRLYAENGDSVLWKAKTPGNAHYSAMIFFPKETPFADKTSGRPITSLVWSDRVPNSPEGYVVEQSGTYKYYVAVYDEDHQKPYSDDPKIIVGNGNMEATAQIRSAIDDLKQAYTELSRKPKLQEQANRIEAIKNELQHILDEIGR